MKYHSAITVLLAAFVAGPTSVFAATELDVIITDGPNDCGDEAIEKGNFIEVAYTGYIDDSSETGEKGLKFESSYDEDREPIPFEVGKGHVIEGWERGVLGLCAGNKATIIIPPKYAYGEVGDEDIIPGNATLRFDVEILNVEAEAPPDPNFYEMIDTNLDGEITEDEALAFFKSEGYDEIPEDLWEREDWDGKIVNIVLKIS